MDRLLEYSGHHPWLAAYAAVAAVALLIYELRARANSVSAISPQTAVQLMNQGAAVLDVRTPEAYSAGHLAGARRLDTSQIADAGNSLKRFKQRPVIVYCERGVSAAPAVRSLLQQGFTQVVNLRGGISAWRAESLPLTRD